MSYLLDSNVISELRKRERADPHVQQWFADVDDGELFLSVLTLGEIRRGIDSSQRRDQPRALALNRWFHALATSYETRIVPVDQRVAEEWGRMNAVAVSPPSRPSILAATATQVARGRRPQTAAAAQGSESRRPRTAPARRSG